MRTLVGVLALSLCPYAALAAPTVTISPAWAGTATRHSQIEAWFTVQITAPAGTVVSVVGNEEPVLLDVEVTASASGSAYVDLSIGGVGSVGPIHRSASNPVRLYLSSVDSSGMINSVDATQIGDIVADFDIVGPISATGTLPLPRSTLPGISRIESRGQFITANITVDHGSNIGTAIGTIQALEKTIGTPSAPVTISARGPIDEIVADDIHAHINTFNSDIKRIHAEGDSGFPGDFTGSLSIRQVVGKTGVVWAIDVKRDLNADITLTEPLTDSIRVGRSFLAGRTISLPTRGLAPTAQVIFNDANPSTPGQWLGSVNVGATALTPVPDYNLFPRDLGPDAANDGGSVGLAEFRVHRNGSTPHHGGTVNAGTLCVNCIEEPPPCVVSFKSALIRHYGPVQINTTVGSYNSSNVYKVEHSLNNSTWTNVTSDFKVSINDVAQITNGGRDWLLQRGNGGDFSAGYYLVTLEQNTAGNPSITRLRSLISGNGAFVPGYEYRFRVIADCNSDIESLFDINQDSWINANDIGAWMVNPTDLTADNAVTGADLNRIVIGVATYGN